MPEVILGIVLIALVVVLLLAGVTVLIGFVASWAPLTKWHAALADEGLLPPAWEITWTPAQLFAQIDVYRYLFHPTIDMTKSPAERWRQRASFWLGGAFLAMSVFAAAFVVTLIVSLLFGT